MNFEVFISCAVTGAGDTVGKHPAIPVTPQQIAEAALDAARAGAAIAHCHVRDPETGIGSRDPALYREVVERIRESNSDLIINLTSGMGGDLAIGQGESPMEFGSDTDLVGPHDPARPRGDAVAGHLFAGLRHAELRRRQFDLRLDPGDAARRRKAHSVFGREA